MEKEEYTSIQKATTVGSIEQYRRLHELAKRGMEPDLSEDYIDDEDGDIIPLSMFASSSENEWWFELVNSMGVSKRDLSYSKKTKELSVRMSVFCDDELCSDNEKIKGANMMNVMLKCGSIMFGGNIYDADGRKWNIEIIPEAQNMFGMFLRAVEEADAEDEDGDLNNSLRGMMAYESGLFNGIIKMSHPTFKEFMECMRNTITATDD